MKEVSIPYTPYGQLKEGDEFIRVGGYPVLLTNMNGRREGNKFTPTDFGRGKFYFVRRMARNLGGYLEEINTGDEDHDLEGEDER